MAVYSGAVPAPPPVFVVRAVCFTAGTAALVRTALTVAAGLLGALVGAAALRVVLVPLAELLAPGVAIVLGAALGAAGGVVLVRRLIAAGACPCPPGAEGFCIGIVYLNSPPAPPIPIGGPVGAPPGSCALIPPGCP